MGRRGEEEGKEGEKEEREEEEGGGGGRGGGRKGGGGGGGGRRGEEEGGRGGWRRWGGKAYTSALAEGKGALRFSAVSNKLVSLRKTSSSAQFGERVPPIVPRPPWVTHRQFLSLGASKSLEGGGLPETGRVHGRGLRRPRKRPSASPGGDSPRKQPEAAEASCRPCHPCHLARSIPGRWLAAATSPQWLTLGLREGGRTHANLSWQGGLWGWSWPV